MYKSVFTFGLLASSLVMLAVLPLLNNNNNAAMAQGYDNYEDSYYSQYPTDDKTYECRTGPFEGFFVGSVEFCQHFKFDKDDRKDSRDNRTGTQGPPGPQGPQGIQGPPGLNVINGTNGINDTQGQQGLIGPQGPNRINSSSIYSVPGNSSSTTFTGLATSIAKCIPGDTVLSGSYFAQFIGNVGFIQDNALMTQDGWNTTASGPSTPEESVHILTIAQCFDNPPLRP